ncbi:MAG: hypothetical protein ACR2HR_06545 [Euzebya sp.]
MTYIVNRRDRFYVVAYDGIDPISGRQRRRWHPADATKGIGPSPTPSAPLPRVPPPVLSAAVAPLVDRELVAHAFDEVRGAVAFDELAVVTHARADGNEAQCDLGGLWRPSAAV